MVRSLYILKPFSEAITEIPSWIHLVRRYLVIVISMSDNLRMTSLMDMEFFYHLKKWNGFMVNLLRGKWLKYSILTISAIQKITSICGKELFWIFIVK